MKVLQYLQTGQWSEAYLPDRPDLQDLTDWVEDLLNMRPLRVFVGSEGGNSDTGDIEVYGDEDRHAYIAMVCPFEGAITTVYMDGFPSLLEFLAKFVPALALEQTNADLFTVSTQIEPMELESVRRG